MAHPFGKRRLAHWRPVAVRDQADHGIAPVVNSKDMHRGAGHKWFAATVPAKPDQPLNDNYGVAGHCPSCGAAAPVGCLYLGSGLVHYHWACKPCGHEWRTAVGVP